MRKGRTVLSHQLLATMQVFPETIPYPLKIMVRRVCINRCEGLPVRWRVALLDAQVMVDRLHVAVQYRKAADELRKDRIPPDQRRTSYGLHD
ncbi:MAG: hypothetical protein P9F75_11395 [Candidatus Contendobacter sp.]|nr:hypothetical protein [Candidatus Contendobacter sp.]